eukprot:scaffold27_cov355-Prasinococcus_capsulatus_cf.AAC.19
MTTRVLAAPRNPMQGARPGADGAHILLTWDADEAAEQVVAVQGMSGKGSAFFMEEAADASKMQSRHHRAHSPVARLKGCSQRGKLIRQGSTPLCRCAVRGLLLRFGTPLGLPWSHACVRRRLSLLGRSASWFGIRRTVP